MFFSIRKLIRISQEGERKEGLTGSNGDLEDIKDRLILCLFYNNRSSIIIKMEVSFDQYVRNIRMFYNQLIKGHPKEEQLAPQFKQMI